MKTGIPVSAVRDHKAAKYMFAAMLKLKQEDMVEILQAEYDADENEK